jgi:hypothetical protein
MECLVEHDEECERESLIQPSLTGLKTPDSDSPGTEVPGYSQAVPDGTGGEDRHIPHGDSGDIPH